jgi:large conductance mechanosensitive channel
MLREFKAFLFRGNLIDLAVALVIGLAFTALVTAFVADLITPIIAALFGSPDFSAYQFTINGSAFRYGSFLNALLAFVAVAAAIFFFVVKPMNAITARTREPVEEVAMRECPECLTSIPAAARRCSACTAQVGALNTP